MCAYQYYLTDTSLTYVVFTANRKCLLKMLSEKSNGRERRGPFAHHINAKGRVNFGQFITVFHKDAQRWSNLWPTFLVLRQNYQILKARSKFLQEFFSCSNYSRASVLKPGKCLPTCEKSCKFVQRSSEILMTVATYCGCWGTQKQRISRA